MKRDDDWPEEKPCKLKNMVNPRQELAEKEGMRERRERNGEPFLIPLLQIRPVLSIQYLADIRADILADIWSPHHSTTPKVLNIGQKYRH
jgi:hypothetical protein